MNELIQNTFFTKHKYDTEIDLNINEDVLSRIYNDNIQSTDKLEIEFTFITDKENKALSLKHVLGLNFPEYSNLLVSESESGYELQGTTNKIQMEIDVINAWNKIMWDLGYKFDCKLDGWEVGT